MTATYVPGAAVVTVDAPAGRSPDENLLRALEVWEALEPVAAPLALRLLLGSFDETYGEAGVDAPQAPAWELVERGLPEHVVPAAQPGVRRSEASLLDRDAIERWAQVALHQPPPAPGEVVDVADIQCHWLRALVSDLPTSAPEYELLTTDGVIALPLERRGTETFVLAPVGGLWLSPPMDWIVTRRLDGLRAAITVNWSPWLDAGRPEGAGVRAAALRLAGQGWSLAESVYPLGLDA